MRIVCVGDSLTRGVTFINGGLHILRETYPKLLQVAFNIGAEPGTAGGEPGQAASKVSGGGDDSRGVVGGGAQVSHVEVVNRGAFNDNSDRLVGRLERDVLAIHPDVVVIGIGSNDSTFHWDQVAAAPDDEHEAVVPLKRYLDNVTKVVEEIRAFGAVPVVLTLLPPDPARYYLNLARIFGKQIAHWIGSCGGIEPWHRAYDQALRTVLNQLSVDMVDVRAAFDAEADTRNSEWMSDDGIHLTARGYQWLSEVVFDGLRTKFTLPTGAASVTVAQAAMPKARA